MIDGVMIKALKVIPDERGWLMEMLRDDDEFFQKLRPGLPDRWSIPAW